MQDQHKKITGYRDLTQAEIDMKNEIAAAEAARSDLWQKAKDVATSHILDATRLDHNQRAGDLHESARQAALARTCFEQGFMHLSRSVLRPVSPWVKEGLTRHSQ